jgi:hypothetical protein
MGKTRADADLEAFLHVSGAICTRVQFTPPRDPASTIKANNQAVKKPEATFFVRLL